MQLLGGLQQLKAGALQQLGLRGLRICVVWNKMF